MFPRTPSKSKSEGREVLQLVGQDNGKNKVESPLIGKSLFSARKAKRPLGRFTTNGI
jgi:hypothetical protein